jgi:hypothetical protein
MRRRRTGETIIFLIFVSTYLERITFFVFNVKEANNASHNEEDEDDDDYNLDDEDSDSDDDSDNDNGRQQCIQS